MTALECLQQAQHLGDHYQLAINSFIDEFRSAGVAAKAQMIREPLPTPGKLEGLIAAVVSALSREAGVEAPEWVARIHSPEPFFAFPARSDALRVRLMLEAPAPFRVRNVFVPENYLSRA